MRFTLRQIEYFVAVGETGSIALAAERLNISPPSVSAAVAHLEAVFAIALFIRHHAQGVSLTPEGRRFLAEAKGLLANAAALHAVANGMANDVRGPLALGCLVVVAPLLLAALRVGFERAHPAVSVNATVGHQGQLIEDLRAARIDLAVTYDLGLPPDLPFEELAVLPPHALVAETHPLAGRAEVTLAELAPLPLVLLDLPLSRDYLLGLFEAEGLRPTIRERMPDYEVLRSLVASGFGYGLGNVRRPPDGQGLRTLRIAGTPKPVVLGVATARHGTMPRVLRAFRDYCRSTIDDETIPGMAPPP
jgi:DNA-binding transcriptional LysR family regulator